ncbi:hypothetical protein OIU76_003771 [Salix suchowensis]|uniref:Uncharacterized protein n=1 Tax=Salix suchowensis TaxID=1278906 RepID=A0ABQ9BP99_9ROSI|nr:hypothetical protein OIU76_003771 [Salix suchowensis]KAJ6388341.1 hypothetical protein OIU77_026841 [Salix suchowensis]
MLGQEVPGMVDVMVVNTHMHCQRLMTRLLPDKGWLYMVTVTANDPSHICFLMRKKNYCSEEISPTNKSVSCKSHDSLCFTASPVSILERLRQKLFLNQKSQMKLFQDTADKERRIEQDFLSEIISSILMRGNQEQANLKVSASCEII